MAAYHATYQTDLAGPSRVLAIPHIFAMGDSESHTFTAMVYDSTDPECGLLAGTVSGVVVRPDGGTVPLTGTKGSAVEEVTLADGSTAQATPCSLTLIQGCFAYPGQITIVIRLVSGDTQTAVLVARGTVTTSLTDTIVDPGEVVPDITTLIATAEQAVEDAEDALAQASAVVSYETQTPTAAQQTQARENLAAAGSDELAATDARIDALHSLIDYGASETEQSASRYGITCTTSPGMVRLDGEKTNTTYSLSFRIYGTISYRNGPPTAAFNVASGAYVKAGHTYDIHMKLVSGTCTEGYAMPVLYAAGSGDRLNPNSTAVQHPDFDGHRVYRARFDADTEIALSVMVSNECSFSSAVYAVWIEDVTDTVYAMSASIATAEAETAQAAHAVGDLIMLGGILYGVTAAIASGETITIGTNVTTTTIAERLAALEARIAALET